MADPITKKAWYIAVNVLLKKVFQGMFDWLQQEVAYIVSYESKVQDLKQRVEDLQHTRDRVKRQVEAEIRNGKEIGPEIEKWLKEVDDIIHEHVEFEKLDDHKNAGCSGGLFPNPQSRYILGKKAYEMAQQVKGLREDSNFDGFSFWLGPMSVDYVLSTIGYESFKSRQETIEKIKKKLKDSSVRIRVIGVWGLGGVGKTTLTKKVAEEVRDTFNVIAMASVTRNPDPKKIQGEIADMLGMRLDEESEIGRGDRIRNRLKKETKNTLIILDDLWGKLDLSMLGIPSAEDDCSKREKNEKSPTDRKREEKEKSPTDREEKEEEKEKSPNDGKREEKEKSPTEQGMFKILLTSRSKEVLSSQMGVDNNSIFDIQALQENEAEKLFKKMAGLPDRSPAFEQLSTNIVKKCGGLPLAVVTIGRALKGKSHYEWNDVLRQLERKEFTGVQKSLEFSTRFSFNHLENEELKSAFLLCAQRGHHPLILDLMKHCYSLRVLKGCHTIKEARDQTLTLIRKLKASSLLLDSDSSDNIRMHDMVRDVALSMLAKERRVLTRRDDKLDEWPEKDQLKRLSSISLCNCDISDDLPKGIHFGQLKVFHIESRDPFMRIPDRGMTKLSVLILTGICLPHLPFSNDSLANNLRMLCLEQCQLDVTSNLNIIGKLKKLRILSFSGSQIKELPSELGKLSKLQLFDISNCSQLQVIPPKVMSCLYSLEELYMRNSPIQWGVEENPNNKTQKATLTELSYLHQLKNLDVCISDAAVIPRNLFLDELDSYKILIGVLQLPSKGDFALPNKYEASRTLVLQLKDGMDIHTYNGIKMLFKRVERLLLGELHGIKNVFYELNLDGFRCLKHFSIQNNSDIQCIIESKEMSATQDAFPNLEWLFLYNLENIKTICCSELTDSSFCKLKFIKIKNCAQLKSIFPISMVRLLKHLEEVEVSDCELLKGIVVREENTNNNRKDAEKIEFLGLRSLVLQSLSVFTSFFTKVNGGVITSPSIFNEQVEIPNLETLELSSINNEIQNIWSGQPAPSFSFRKLVTLNVNDCKGLTYLFSFSEAKNLENLKTISVSKCDKMENIFKSEEISTTEAKVCIFPKLEKIYLSDMMSLSEIWHSKDVRVDPFPTLSSVIISYCEKLVTIFPRHTVGLFRHLEKLNIYGCNSVIEIFDLKDAPQNNEAGNETNLRFVYIWNLKILKHVWNQDPKGILSFKNMQRIEVGSCDNLENLFPPSFAKGLENLDYLSITDCPKLHELIAWDKGEETSDISLEFPRLTFMQFRSLPKLESIYQGIRHTLESPLLKKLVVGTCDKLEVIPTETKNQDNPPAFLPEKVISNLEYMNLSQKEAKRLHHYLDSHLLRRLKELQIDSLQSNAILYKILHRIPNLEKLSLWKGHLKELLPSGSLVAHEKIGTVIQIKELKLQWMNILENIGFEHDPDLQRVEQLYLLACYNLKSLAPSRVSFTHLKSLEVSLCHKLLNLMGSSTAETLVELTTMKVTQCNAITEIVAKARNEDEIFDQHEIVFRKLMTLELESLENLTSFCNCKNHSLNFPVLERLIVRECPKMKIFSESLATAPILRQVSLAYAKDEGMWLCEPDLNVALAKISTEMVFLKYIESLKLSQYPELERVWHCQESLGDDNFRNLKILEVTNCDFLSSVIPFHLLAYLKNLEDLEVSNCNLVEVIFDMNDTKTNFGLKTLSLKDLPKLKHVWNKDPRGLISFHSLKYVSVDSCKLLETLFPKSVAKILLELEELRITNCGTLEEIVGKEEVAADGKTDEMFEFRRLAKLRLSELPKLKCFYRGRFNLKCPVLKDLYVNQCGMFGILKSESQSYEKAASEDEIIPIEAQSLFSVQEDPEHERVWHGQVFLPDNSLCNLKKLAVTDCNFLSTVIPSHLFAYLKNLEELKVTNCNLVEVIFDINDTKTNFGLETLSLKDLPKLKHVWNKDPQGLISFHSLKDVSVDGCKRLETLFPKSVAKNLLELEELDIRNCRELEEIVGKEEVAADGKTDEMFEFPRLAKLRLSELPELKCFYWGRFNLKCPELEDLYVNQCGMFGIFKAESQSYEKAASEDEIIPIEARSPFSVQEDPELERVWHGQVFLPDDSLCNLKKLAVTDCDFLSSVIPSHLLAYLKNLEELKVSNCNLVEVIFDMNDTKTNFGLKTLSLEDLPKLKHVWNKDPQGLISFHTLKDVSVNGCKRLETLFPKSVAKNLLELEMLRITNCGALEEIVGKEDAAADGAIDEIFGFPRLATLWLSELPELKCFYWGRFNLKCPVLETLYIYECGKLEIFTSEPQSYEEAVSQDQIIAIEAPSLFSVQEVIPILKEVTLNEKDIKMLWQGGFEKNLDKLKKLQLQCFHNVNETDHLPFEILEKVPNLETLTVACSGFKQIFFSPILEGYHPTIPAQLKKLELYDLPRFNSIGSEHSSMDPVLENLEVLEVRRCSCSTKLIQSSVSFSNLKKMFIIHCHGLVYLFTPSTARRLVRLEIIYIERCESIKEIVAEDGDEPDSPDEIMFEKLKWLWLYSLPSLASFYSGNSTLKLPCLETLSVTQCPRMKTFSNGIIEAPVDHKSTVEKLFNEKVHLASMTDLKLSNFPELKELWLSETPLPGNRFSKLTTLVVENCEFLSVVIPSNLLPCFKHLQELRVQNCSSVETIFDISGIEISKTEEKAFPLKKLTLDQLPNLKLVWNKNPHTIMGFEKFEKVKVSDCESLQYLFPAASMAKDLRELEIQNCGALVEILGKDYTTAGESETFEFPRLTIMILNHLPELNCFYPGRLNLKCPALKVLNVYHCGKLEMFTSENKSIQALPEDQVGDSVNAPPVFMNEEVTPKLEEVSLNEKETMTLWREEYQANFLHNIHCLQLYCFHSVTDREDTLPYGILHKVPNLEILAVACSDFKEIFPSGGLEDEHIRMLSKLKGLRLEALPKLNSTGLEHYAGSFSNLKELIITKCHKLVYLFTSSTGRSMVQLRRMSIEKCESMKEIVAKEEGESTVDEIVFGELTKLSLNNLSSLGCFYRGSSTLRFPYLQEAIIVQCSKMKAFSEGPVSAPQLPAIQVSLETEFVPWERANKIKDVRWEGDLNSTVKKLYKGKGVIVSP